MTKIFCVIGEAGEFAEAAWNVCAYEDEGVARKHAEEAQRFSSSLSERMRGMDWDEREAASGTNPWDASYDDSPYEPASYTVQEIVLRKRLPNVA